MEFVNFGQEREEDMRERIEAALKEWQEIDDDDFDYDSQPSTFAARRFPDRKGELVARRRTRSEIAKLIGE